MKKREEILESILSESTTSKPYFALMATKKDGTVVWWRKSDAKVGKPDWDTELTPLCLWGTRGGAERGPRSEHFYDPDGKDGRTRGDFNNLGNGDPSDETQSKLKVVEIRLVTNV